MKPTNKKQQQQVLTEWLNNVPEEIIDCRDLRHSWRGNHSTSVLGHGFIGRIIVCNRCGVIKQQVIDPSGKVVVNRYGNYPDDYKKPKMAPPGRLSPLLIRKESVNRSAIVQASPDLVAIFNKMTGK